MGLIENAIISITKLKMKNAFNSGEVKEVSSEGLKEYRDIPYTNRAGKELLMDIFEPIAPVNVFSQERIFELLKRAE